MTGPEVRGVLGIIVEAYPGRVRVSDETVAVWTQALADLPLSEVLAAVRRLVRTSEWPPSIAAICAECLDDGITEAEGWRQLQEWLLLPLQESAKARNGPPPCHPLVLAFLRAYGANRARESALSVLQRTFTRWWPELRAEHRRAALTSAPHLRAIS